MMQSSRIRALFSVAIVLVVYVPLSNMYLAATKVAKVSFSKQTLRNSTLAQTPRGGLPVASSATLALHTGDIERTSSHIPEEVVIPATLAPSNPDTIRSSKPDSLAPTPAIIPSTTLAPTLAHATLAPTPAVILSTLAPTPAVIPSALAPTPAGVQAIEIEPTVTLANDVVRIWHDPANASVTVELKSNATCSNPVFRARLSGPSLSILEWARQGTLVTGK
jgi:hypothetical protein